VQPIRQHTWQRVRPPLNQPLFAQVRYDSSASASERVEAFWHPSISLASDGIHNFPLHLGQVHLSGLS
jgi:hypothetical protein